MINENLAAGTIRLAEEKDIPLILEFIRGIAEYERLSHKVTADEDIIRGSMFSPGSNVKALFYEIEGAVTAYAVFFENFSTFTGKKGIYLEDIFVRDEYRRRGIGERLLKFIARYAVANDHPRMEWAVLNWNKPALDFYDSIGAERLKEWTLFRLSGDELKTFADK